MKKKRQLKKLTIQDNFMFGAVMVESEMDFEDDFVKTLQETIHQIKKSGIYSGLSGRS